MDEANNGRGQLAFELSHTPAHGEGDFLVGEGNATAHGRIPAYPHWSEPLTLLIGPAASGKSHLARIFADLQRRPFRGGG
ncbi:hypothetical protein N8D56_17140 [Devosia sp. A8/3-2]|nr:hypothetical protein N8D56_17140 [Devosia sp. A8/3-2]